MQRKFLETFLEHHKQNEKVRMASAVSAVITKNDMATLLFL